MVFGLVGLAAITFVAYVMLPESTKDWSMAIPIIGVGLAVVLVALFVLVMTTWVGWTIHPLVGLFAGGLVLLFDVQLARLMLRELL